jgi:RecJ-like exonuclease
MPPRQTRKRQYSTPLHPLPRKICFSPFIIAACGGCHGKGYDTVQCGRCHGTGQNGTTTFKAMCNAGCAGRGKDRRGANCSGCGGTGQKTYTQPKKCQPCQGTGTGSEVCRYCGGTGLK